MAASIPLNLLRLKGYSILQQLLLEEALLRGTKSNWLLLNDGTPQPTIVMGISGRAHELVNVGAAKSASVPVLRRFSGGGTVVVDAGTLFATLVLEGSSLPHVQCYPQPIMQWTESLYRDVFGKYGDFRLRENDYVFGERKFGGNAQSITGKRWLHHTSLLWEFTPERMALLKQPAKAPAYRQGREHLDFLLPLSDVAPSRQALLDSIVTAAAGQGFDVVETSVEAALKLADPNTLSSTKVVDLDAA